MTARTTWTDREIGVITFAQGTLTSAHFLSTARFASGWGEHSLGWLAIAATGAVIDPARRRMWVRAGGATFAAHLAAVVVKRLVSRTRPESTSVLVRVATPSRLSFPSAHAASTAAFVTALPTLPRPVAVGIVGAMGLSRILLGVHYPTDVLAGTALGYVSARSMIRFWERSA